MIIHAYNGPSDAFIYSKIHTVAKVRMTNTQSLNNASAVSMRPGCKLAQPTNIYDVISFEEQELVLRLNTITTTLSLTVCLKGIRDSLMQGGPTSSG